MALIVTPAVFAFKLSMNLAQGHSTHVSSHSKSHLGCKEDSEWASLGLMNGLDRISSFSGLLVTTEVGLGTWIHALRIPLGGQFLSLNQGFLLSFASRKLTRKEALNTAYGISTVSAILKSLAPMGKKLTPMLAIWMQGVLFSVGVGLAGTGVAGITLGMMLLSTWSFIQPAVLAMLVFGVDPLSEWLKLFPGFSEYVVWIIASAVLFKALLAGLIGFLALRLPDTKVTQLLQSLSSWKSDQRSSSRHWIWLIMTLLIGGSLFFIHGESSVPQFIKYVLRPLAVSLILFWLSGVVVRRIHFERLASHYPVIGAALARVKRDLSSSS